MIKNAKLGGADWESPSRVKPTDLNDTFDAVASRISSTRGIYDDFEQVYLDVTSSDDYVSYSKELTSHVIQNTGSNPCFITFDEISTLNSWKLNPADFVIFDGKVTDIHAICDSGKTTKLRAIGQ